MHVIGKYLDALYCSVKFEFPKHLENLLSAEKTALQETEDKFGKLCAIDGVPGGVFFLRRKSAGFYQYVMENGLMWVGMTAADNIPSMSIQYKAKALYKFTQPELEAIIDAFVRGWIGPQLTYKVSVTRTDYAVDFQMKGWQVPQLRDVIRRARSWSMHGEESDVPTGLTFGKRNGALQVQFYNKTNELAQSGKEWMYEVWEGSGNYDPELPVWRCEVRFFREVLRQFGVRTMQDLWGDAGAIGDMLMFSVGNHVGAWIRVASRVRRDNRSNRRSTAGWWKIISAAFVEGEALQGLKREGCSVKHSLQAAVDTAGRAVEKVIALLRYTDKESKAYLTPRLSYYRASAEYERLLTQRQQTWAERVNLRTADLRAVAW